MAPAQLRVGYTHSDYSANKAQLNSVLLFSAALSVRFTGWYFRAS